MNREELSREQQLRQEIDLIEAVTAQFEAAAGDLLTENELSPSNARAREEVIALLGVNYVGPENLGKLLYGDESKFPQVELDYVKLKEILNEPDEWEIDKRKFETYALVFKPPISFLEIEDKANRAAIAQGKPPVFYDYHSFHTHAFTREAPKTGSWELVRRETVPGSTSRGLGDQKELIAGTPNLIIASLPALAALLVGQYLAHNIRLYGGEARYGRTSTYDDARAPAFLGDMDSSGAFLDVYLRAHDYIGLAVSLNLNSEFGDLRISRELVTES